MWAREGDEPLREGGHAGPPLHRRYLSTSAGSIGSPGGGSCGSG
jgi:hypothetical protein